MNKNVLTEFLQRQNEFLQGRLDETPAPAISAESTSSTTSATSSTDVPHGRKTPRSKNTATCSLTAGKGTKIAAQNPDGFFFMAYLLSRTVVQLPVKFRVS